MDMSDALLVLPPSPDELAQRWRALFDQPELRALDGKVELGPWGEVILMSPVGRIHSLVAGDLMFLLRSRLGGRTFAEAGIVTPNGVRAPDVMWADDDWVATHPESPMRVAPPLCIEVVSPFDRIQPLTDKLEAYLAAGAREAWLVIPREAPGIRFLGPEGLRETSVFGFSHAEIAALAVHVEPDAI